MSTIARGGRRAVVAIAVAVASVLAAVPGAATASTASTVGYDGAGPGAARIGLIGDSTLSSLRLTNAFAPLRRWNYTFDAESCRRTITASCRIAGGHAPENALAVMRRLSGQLGRVLVMMEGYNDPADRFGEAVDAVVAEARAQSVSSVVWLTLRTAATPKYGAYNDVLQQRDQQYRGYLVVADWATYSGNHPEWVNSGGIHVTSVGAPALAQFITDSVARLLAGAPVPAAPAAVWVDVPRGARGAGVVEVQQALLGHGIRLVGGADGDFGARTQAAVVAFQRSVGLPADGIVSAATAHALGLAPDVPATPVAGWSSVGQGARGESVAAIQRALIGAGVVVRGGDDGYFGSRTKAAVATFQRSRGLAASGVVDAETAAALGLGTPFAGRASGSRAPPVR
jgi:peptidoglycan hydrolase-like protein with peptidoglycan-binding domain